ncbi:preprotein translocase subunit SecE [Candidatus Riesia pediculischaeffi]
MRWSLFFFLLTVSFVGMLWGKLGSSTVLMGCYSIIFSFISTTLVSKIKKTRLLLKFIEDVFLEMKKVHWPSFQETLRITFVILLVAMITSFFIWMIDNILVRLISSIITLRL